MCGVQLLYPTRKSPALGGFHPARHGARGTRSVFPILGKLVLRANSVTSIRRGGKKPSTPPPCRILRKLAFLANSVTDTTGGELVPVGKRRKPGGLIVVRIAALRTPFRREPHRGRYAVRVGRTLSPSRAPGVVRLAGRGVGGPKIPNAPPPPASWRECVSRASPASGTPLASRRR